MKWSNIGCTTHSAYPSLKDNQIIGHKKINDTLRENNANQGVKIDELRKSESELKEKLRVMEVVAGEVKDDKDEEQRLVNSE